MISECVLRRLAVFAVAAAFALDARPASADDPRDAAEKRVDFTRQIRPILAEKCFACHGPDEHARKAGVRLDIRDQAIEPADSGETPIVPGHPERSELVRRTAMVKGSERMPPPKSDKSLTPDERELLTRWVREGAEYQSHWAFSAPRRPEIPAMAGTRWGRNAVDRFILAGLNKAELRPTAEANKTTLIRRLSLDLTGLPPTPGEVDAFLNDERADAYEQLVERLLASPHFGERMALEWLDAARFADTHGYHIDSGRDMSRWRAWVINAYNMNMPFDQFSVEQLAGDLLPNPTLAQRVASGFNRNHMINFEGGAVPEEYQTAYIVDRVNTTSTVWLGLTVACAQCHDHKYDPITQRDFYSLYAFFHNIAEKGLDGARGNAAPTVKLGLTKEQSAELHAIAAEMDRATAELKRLDAELDRTQAYWESNAAAAKDLDPRIRQILAKPAPNRTPSERDDVTIAFRSSLSPSDARLRDQLQELNRRRQAISESEPTAMVMEEMSSPRDTFVLVRGQYDKRGEKVVAAVPAFLPPLPADAPRNRLGLARWLVDRSNPLTARVAVNRYWQMLFGTGLVKTSEDFGTQGDAPSHRELLDWLAVEFQDPTTLGANAHRWDIKALIRLIVTSATYRQASVTSEKLVAQDPDNRLLARGPRFRLAAEFIRDQALAVSGLLHHEIGGKSVSPYQPPGLWEELMSREDGANWSAQTYKQDHGVDLYRRTMYTFWKRTCPPPTLATFDAPDREICTVRRARTNTPLQALVLLNDPTYVEAARKLAERMMKDGGATNDQRIAFAFRLATARRPSDAETNALRALFEEEREHFAQDAAAALKLLSVGESPRDHALDASRLAAWTTVASVILNLDETLTRN